MATVTQGCTASTPLLGASGCKSLVSVSGVDCCNSSGEFRVKPFHKIVEFGVSSRYNFNVHLGRYSDALNSILSGQVKFFL